MLAPFHSTVNDSTSPGTFNTENRHSFNPLGRLNALKCCVNITSIWVSFTHQQEAVVGLLSRLAEIAGDWLIFCCIQAAKRDSPLLWAVKCKAPPIAAHDSLTSFLFSSRFWTLTVGCFYIVRAKENPGSYSEVKVGAAFSPAILLYTKRI